MSVPDLRRASESTHAEFLGIVIGGARESKGMPRYGDMSVDDGEAIRAFIHDRAWAAYDAQEQSKAR